MVYCYGIFHACLKIHVGAVKIIHTAQLPKFVVFLETVNNICNFDMETNETNTYNGVQLYKERLVLDR